MDERRTWPASLRTEWAKEQRVHRPTFLKILRGTSLHPSALGGLGKLKKMEVLQHGSSEVSMIGFLMLFVCLSFQRHTFVLRWMQQDGPQHESRRSHLTRMCLGSNASNQTSSQHFVRCRWFNDLCANCMLKARSIPSLKLFFSQLTWRDIWLQLAQIKVARFTPKINSPRVCLILLFVSSYSSCNSLPSVWA
jgi:hypothetical protein